REAGKGGRRHAFHAVSAVCGLSLHASEEVRGTAPHAACPSLPPLAQLIDASTCSTLIPSPICSVP
ncbi:hypothetical protein HAX54_045328, partial [Datura stramonium]|nr:hypothetical protein [Datura stramonium]